MKLENLPEFSSENLFFKDGRPLPMYSFSENNTNVSFVFNETGKEVERTFETLNAQFKPLFKEIFKQGISVFFKKIEYKGTEEARSVEYVKKGNVWEKTEKTSVSEINKADLPKADLPKPIIEFGRSYESFDEQGRLVQTVIFKMEYGTKFVRTFTKVLYGKFCYFRITFSDNDKLIQDGKELKRYGSRYCVRNMEDEVVSCLPWASKEKWEEIVSLHPKMQYFMRIEDDNFTIVGNGVVRTGNNPDGQRCYDFKPKVEGFDNETNKKFLEIEFCNEESRRVFYNDDGSSIKYSIVANAFIGHDRSFFFSKYFKEKDGEKKLVEQERRLYDAKDSNHWNLVETTNLLQ